MAGEPIPPLKKPDGPPEWLLRAKRDAISDCCIFYTGKQKPRPCASACFPWECGAGWNDVLAKLSYGIETLNMQYYPKYRVRCEAEQIKEKFGTLRVYTRVVVDPPAWRSFLPSLFRKIADRIDARRVDYKMKKVVDRERHVKYEYEQLTKDEFENTESRKYKCSNVEYIEDSGKYYRVTALDCYEESHTVPSAHKVLYSILTRLVRFESMLNAWAVTERTRAQRIIAEHFEKEVEKIASDAEHECYCRCEECGVRIGDSWNPRCETKGWISYLCETCAEKRNAQYVKVGTNEKDKTE